MLREIRHAVMHVRGGSAACAGRGWVHGVLQGQIHIKQVCAALPGLTVI